MAEFLSMGGYAQYVWPAYGISFLVLAVMIVLTIRQNRRVDEQLRQIRPDDDQT